MRSRRPPHRRAAGATPDRLTPPLPGRATALLAGIGALGAALVLLRVSEWGAGVGADSAYFVSAAQNLRDGHGFVNYRGDAFTGHGPLLPLALAFLGLFRLDPVGAAGWLHAAAFGLTVFVVAVWVRARTRSGFLAVWAGLACALSPSLAHWASLVMTEPLFILFATLSLFALDRWLGGERAASDNNGGGGGGGFCSPRRRPPRLPARRATSASRWSPARCRWC